MWAIVEVMGHRTYAGRVSEQHIAGVGFVRLDIPEVDGKGGASKLLNPRSIFGIHETTEVIARSYVARTHGAPIDLFAKFGATQPVLLEGGWREREDWSDDEFGDDDEHDDVSTVDTPSSPSRVPF